MYTVVVTDEALNQLADLPFPIQRRVIAITERLAHWPNVSGKKPLRGKLRGHWRLRTGAYRVLITVKASERRIIVWKIDNRKDVYED